MRRVFMYVMSVLAAGVLLPTAAFAGKPNAADYPLRVHIFMLNGYSHYYRSGAATGSFSSLDSVDGEGRANLYENSQPRGFDFSYSCGRRLMFSAGFDTYAARWKKQDRILEILQPAMGGKPGEMNACELKVTMKETVYFRGNGGVGEEPAAAFKSWMEKHEYDPEHGKTMPVFPPAPQPGNGTTLR